MSGPIKLKKEKGMEITWNDFRLDNRNVALDTDISGLVTSFSDTNGLIEATYTQTGTARDGFREGRTWRWNMPSAYKTDERDYLLFHLYDIDWGGAGGSAAIIAVGLTNGTNMATANGGNLAGLYDQSATHVQTFRVVPTGGTLANIVPRTDVETIGHLQHVRRAKGSLEKWTGTFTQTVFSSGGSDNQSAFNSLGLTANQSYLTVMIGSLGTGTLTRTVRFRARWAHIRLPVTWEA